MNILSGRIWKLGDNVDSHVLLSSKYDPVARARDYQNLAPHVLENICPEFVQKVRKGDLIVAGDGFGSGKHLHGLINALRILGVDAVIARSFSNTFEREAINIGFPALTYATVYANVADGDDLELDMAASQARNITTGKVFNVAATDPGIIEILDAGGLAPLTLRRLGLPALSYAATQ